jgi:hypothetical protein
MEGDQVVHYVAIGEEVPHYSLLSEVAVEQWNETRTALHKQYVSGDENARIATGRLIGCLEKLRASLIQVDRLRKKHDELIETARQMVAAGHEMAALSGPEACAEFEGLLLHGRSALDCLTWYVSARYKQPCQSFRKIKNILENFTHKDDDAKQVLSFVEQSDGWFHGALGRIDKAGSLRDLVAHNLSLSEGIRACFGVNRITPDGVLLIDCEVSFGPGRPIAIFETTHESQKWLSFLVLNVVATMVKAKILAAEFYEPVWANRTLSVSDYLVNEPAGSALRPHSLNTVARAFPVGFTYRTDNVRPELMERVFRL